MEVGDRIKQLRIGLGMTQDELAKKAGTSKQNISRYEKNQLKDIPMSRIVAIAEALETTPATLLGYRGEDKKARQYIHDMIDKMPDEYVGIIELLATMTPQQVEALSVLVQLTKSNRDP